MSVVINYAKERLQQGELAVGFGLGKLRTTEAAGFAQACGFHWLFVDMEHSTIDVDLASQICSAALATNVTPIVRVPGKQHFHMSRLLDGGAMGVVVPHVDTPEQAEEIVSYCKFPPVGHRSMTGLLPQLRYQTVPADQSIPLLNDATMIVVMLESPQAIANADAIAAVDGVDALLIGTNDLAAESGVPGQIGHARIEEAYAITIEACRKHGKFPGMGGVYQHDLMEKYVGMGMRLLLGGADIAFMMAAARNRAEFLNKLTLV
jgi:2-keto-3-deoxy-L-rhamnonate aldolase RhmA